MARRPRPLLPRVPRLLQHVLVVVAVVTAMVTPTPSADAQGAAGMGDAGTEDLLFFLSSKGLHSMMLDGSEHTMYTEWGSASVCAEAGASGFAVDRALGVALAACGRSLYRLDYETSGASWEDVPVTSQRFTVHGVAVNPVQQVAYAAVLDSVDGWLVQSIYLGDCGSFTDGTACNRVSGCAFNPRVGGCVPTQRDRIMSVASEPYGGGLTVDANGYVWLSIGTASDGGRVVSKQGKTIADAPHVDSIFSMAKRPGNEELGVPTSLGGAVYVQAQAAGGTHSRLYRADDTGLVLWHDHLPLFKGYLVQEPSAEAGPSYALFPDGQQVAYTEGSRILLQGGLPCAATPCAGGEPRVLGSYDHRVGALVYAPAVVTPSPPTPLPATLTPPTPAPPTPLPPTPAPPTDAPATTAPETDAPPTWAPSTAAPATAVALTAAPARVVFIATGTPGVGVSLLPPPPPSPTDVAAAAAADDDDDEGLRWYTIVMINMFATLTLLWAVYLLYLCFKRVELSRKRLAYAQQQQRLDGAHSPETSPDEHAGRRVASVRRADSPYDRSELAQGMVWPSGSTAADARSTIGLDADHLKLGPVGRVVYADALHGGAGSDVGGTRAHYQHPDAVTAATQSTHPLQRTADSDAVAWMHPAMPLVAGAGRECGGQQAEWGSSFDPLGDNNSPQTPAAPAVFPGARPGVAFPDEPPGFFAYQSMRVDPLDSISAAGDAVSLAGEDVLGHPYPQCHQRARRTSIALSAISTGTEAFQNELEMRRGVSSSAAGVEGASLTGSFRRVPEALWCGGISGPSARESQHHHHHALAAPQQRPQQQPRSPPRSITPPILVDPGAGRQRGLSVGPAAAALPVDPLSVDGGHHEHGGYGYRYGHGPSATSTVGTPPPPPMDPPLAPARGGGGSFSSSSSTTPTAARHPGATPPGGAPSPPPVLVEPRVGRAVGGVGRGDDGPPLDGEHPYSYPYPQPQPQPPHSERRSSVASSVRGGGGGDPLSAPERPAHLRRLTSLGVEPACPPEPGGHIATAALPRSILTPRTSVDSSTAEARPAQTHTAGVVDLDGSGVGSGDPRPRVRANAVHGGGDPHPPSHQHASGGGGGSDHVRRAHAQGPSAAASSVLAQPDRGGGGGVMHLPPGGVPRATGPKRRRIISGIGGGVASGGSTGSPATPGMKEQLSQTWSRVPSTPLDAGGIEVLGGGHPEWDGPGRRSKAASGVGRRRHSLGAALGLPASVASGRDVSPAEQPRGLTRGVSLHRSRDPIREDRFFASAAAAGWRPVESTRTSSRGSAASSPHTPFLLDPSAFVPDGVFGGSPLSEAVDSGRSAPPGLMPIHVA